MKLYANMSPAEQIDYVQRLSRFETLSLPVLETMKDKMILPSDLVESMIEGLTILTAFPFSLAFAETALKVQDYTRRIYRLRFYLNQIKENISKGIVAQTADGKTVAYVPAAQQQFARRGRPTREEAAAKRLAQQSNATDMETRKQQAIAQMMGLEVVTNQTVREKNNEELKAERELKQQQEEEQNPSLFSPLPSTPSTPFAPSTPLPSQPNLSQLSLLLSPELAERVTTVRDLRSQAAAFAEQAKVMAEHGDAEEKVADVAQRAAQATDAYEKIYEDVDKELATVYLRLREDSAFRKTFIDKYYGNVPSVAIPSQLSNMEKMLKPYYQKQNKEFTASVRLMIAENNPEVVAQKKAEKEKKEAAEKIIRYLRRTDKKPTPKRIEGMEAKYKELVSLLGEKQAKPFYAFIEAARSSNKS